MDMQTLVTSVSAALAGGGIAALVARHMSAKVGTHHEKVLLESADHLVKKAEMQRQKILEEARISARESFEEEAKKQEENRINLLDLQQKFEEDIDNKQKELDEKTSSLDIFNNTIAERQRRLSDLKVRQEELLQEANGIEQTRLEALSHKCGEKPSDLLLAVQEAAKATEQLGLSRWLIEHGEQLKTEASRYAKDILLNVNARYCPTFVWPKIPFTVNVPSKDILERYFADGSDLVTLILADTETLIENVTGEDSHPLIKISGGLGSDKEIIRLSLEEIVSRSAFSADAAKKILMKNRKKIEKLNLKMGADAADYLGIGAVHPEIQKLIGALNYRTSHRQNQYYHSVEVARLAGMLAEELGVDPILAKRSGLLHDIGKVLDYKIEGSHAVISGDYATTYGEEEVVVDTVLAHHNDKVVETAHAYILKAADAMSGARPGARVDMEEGYQKRIEGIADVVKSFEQQGVTSTAIMHAGREVHVFVDHRKITEKQTDPLATEIARKLESDVQFPGQIKVIVVRRTEVSAVA